MTNPFLKWAGGKRSLINQYAPFFPQQYNRYYEPFLGGGAVFFALRPEAAILSDTNPELVNAYLCVRDRLSELIEALSLLSSSHSKEQYLEIRSLGVACKSQIEAAARTIYLNKTCFNGLYRLNRKGEFNVPMGRYKNPAICDRETLVEASKALQGTDLRQGDFESVLVDAGGGDFVYLDPPYHPLPDSTSNFNSYTGCRFTEQDQVRVKQVFDQLTTKGATVLLSNSACPFIKDLYQGYKMQEIQASRNINCNGKKRRQIAELLIYGSG